MSDEQTGTVAHFYIEKPSERVDPIWVYVHDCAPGQGMVTVCCYGTAWTAYWGSMGNKTVREFLARCDPDYLCKNLASNDRKSTKGEYVYRIKVATSVLNHLKDPANV